MNTTARDRLVKVLKGESTPYSDVATLTLPGDALTLEVAEVGQVQLPVKPAQAKRLIAMARPAMFGWGAETIADTSVRDTWEVTPDHIAVAGEVWDAHLAAALTQFREEFGLPASAQLRAELHSLLVYGKGQFFLPHQDSEKHDDMIATLVVLVPSVHTGGELVVDDGGIERTFHGSRDEIVLVAFYCDRRHEVKPVRSGYRVALTFNLMLTGPLPTRDVGPAERAAHHLRVHFTSPIASRHGRGGDLRAPIRLAFLLDHEYTQRGLISHRFKGADVQWVSWLLEAAELADCEVVFALAEVRETAGALPKRGSKRIDGYVDGYVGGYLDGCDVESGGESVDPDDYDIGNVQHDEITLGWWVRTDGSGAEDITLHLGEHQACGVTPSQTLKPYASAYQGYMGNDGNTLDRWYRRAAVVLWPKAKSFAARAEAAPARALESLRSRIEAGDREGARRDAASLTPDWHSLEGATLLLALDVGVGLQDPIAARVVLSPYRLEMVTPAHAASLAALVSEYGVPWANELMDRWASDGCFGGVERTDWVSDTLLGLSQALRENEVALLADYIGDQAWRSLSSQMRQRMLEDRFDLRPSALAKLGVPMARLLEAVSDEVGARVTLALQAEDNDVLDLLISTLRAHLAPARAAFRAISDDISDRMHRLVDDPRTSEDDWSITWTGCFCHYCRELQTFLASPSERTFDWPLAAPGRAHVLRQIGASGLPVTSTTVRRGRPFTLSLAKTATRFQWEQSGRSAGAMGL